MVPDKSRVAMTPADAGSGGENAMSGDGSSSGHTMVDQREPLRRLRSTVGRFRGDGDESSNGNSIDDDRDLKLEVMLLREENARLKIGLHRASGVGTLIDHLRLVAADKGDAEALDDAWSILTECLVIREGLEQACTEIQTAIASVHERLRKLDVRFGDAGVEGETNGALNTHDRAVIAHAIPEMDAFAEPDESASVHDAGHAV